MVETLSFASHCIFYTYMRSIDVKGHHTLNLKTLLLQPYLNKINTTSEEDNKTFRMDNVMYYE